MGDGLKSNSFTKRVAHGARSIKSFIASFFSHGDTDKSITSTVRRFEWFASGASEFMRFVEFGGTPRQCLSFYPINRQLLEGKTLEHQICLGNKRHVLFLLRHFSGNIELGMEARLLLIHKDAISLERNFVLGLFLQLSESTDIMGIAVKCLQLFTADHSKCAVEAAREILTQLPTQDFHWAPFPDSSDKQHWYKVHGLLTQWFRPNPLCCKRHVQPCNPDASSSCESTSKLLDSYLEPVILVYLQHPMVVYDHFTKHRIVMKQGVLFSPHSSPDEDLQLSASGTTPLHVNNVEQLQKIMFPTAMDCVSLSADATGYQMLWNSRHGAAYLQIGRARTARRTTRRTSQNTKKVRFRQLQDPNRERNKVVADFLKAWLPRTPSRLQGSILGWIEDENHNAVSKAQPQRRD